MIGLVTDSTSQIPATLAARLGVEVVAATIELDGVSYREGVDLDADDVWARFEHGSVPEMSTSQPAPGAFAAAYRSLAGAGATEIVSVHVAEAYSGTLNAARLGAELADVPVHHLDSGTASFGVACCVWEAAAAIAAGASVAETLERARDATRLTTTAFIIQAVDFAAAGGRFAPDLDVGTDAVTVFAGTGGGFDAVGEGRTVDELCERLASELLTGRGRLRVGVSEADASTTAFAHGIEDRLRRSGRELEIVRYRVGPSIAAHTGPGTAGGFSCPVDVTTAR